MMREQELNIVALGLENLLIAKSVNDITFIVGDHHHHCPWVILELTRLASRGAVDTIMNAFLLKRKNQGDSGVFCSGWL
jgi:hypothetical protein